MIQKYLDDLESRISPDIEEDLLERWRAFTDGRFTGDIFWAERRRKAPPAADWPEVTVNETLEDFEKMALQQLRACSGMLAERSGRIMCARCNYGTGIMPSLFGAELFIMDEGTNTLPTTRPLSSGAEDVKRLVDRSVPNPQNGLGARTLEMARRFVEWMAPYPKVSKYVFLYHPDMQGPMDICELLWGSGLFIDLVDKPDLVKSFLDLITETYIRFMREWEKIAPFEGDRTVHWVMMHKGHIMLRDDSAMNLSPEMFDEFIKPWDQRLLSEFGGGGIHFCGRGDHYIESASEMTGLHAIAMSQPECNDMETIYRHTVDKGIKLIGLAKEAAREALDRGRDLHGNVHCG